MSETQEYLVVTPLEHDGVEYAPASVVELPREVGDPLVEQGVLSVRRGSGGGGGAPDTDRAQTLVLAIGRLDPNDDSLWTKEGPPKTGALEAEAGVGAVSAEDRNEAWAAHQAANAAG